MKAESPLALWLLAGMLLVLFTTSMACRGDNNQRFDGATMSFTYPQNWHVWDSSFVDGRETVIVANFPPTFLFQGAYLIGSIRIDFYSAPELAVDVISDRQDKVEEVFQPGPSDTKFYVRRGEEITWVMTGAMNVHGRWFWAVVLMETPKPDLEAVRPVLASWQMHAPR